MDCMGSFRREPSGKDDSRIIVDEAACYRGGVAFSLSGALRESDLFLENGFLRMAPSPVSAWKSLEPLLGSWRGDVAARVFFDGHVEDPASYQACGWFTGKGIRPPTMETGVDVFLESSLARCQARVGQGRVSVCDGCDDQVYFAVSTDITLPLEARFSRLDGQVGGFPFQAAGTGEVVVDEATARLEPTLLQVLGGQMEIAGEGSSAGIYALQLLASDLRLSKILGAYLPDLQPEGIVSCRASLLGSSGQRPDLEGEIALRDGALTAGGKRLLGIDADAKVTARGETIQLEPLRILRGKDRIEVFAKGPAPWRSSSPGEELLEASFRADLAEIADLPFPEGQLRDAGGQLALEGTLRGPWTGDESLFPSMDLDAKVKVSNGKLKLYGDIPPLVNIQAELALKNDQVLVRSFTGRLWDADFHISGQARLTLPGREAAPSIHSVDLALLARSALLFRRPELRVRGDLDLRWKGLWERSLLEGDLNVTRAYYLQDVSMTPSRGARQPWPFINSVLKRR